MYKLLSAYTGPTPPTGYVGYVNLSIHDDGVRFSVRQECPYDGKMQSYTMQVTSHAGWPPAFYCDVPKDEAIRMLKEALSKLEDDSGGLPDA